MIDRSIDQSRRISALEAEIARLRADLRGLTDEVQAVAVQYLTLAEVVADESHIAARLLAQIQKNGLKPNQLH
jgi:hypothetical protein